MKKFSKILVVLCLVAVVFGTISFSSSANSITDREMLNITNDVRNYYADMTASTATGKFFHTQCNDSDYASPVSWSKNRANGVMTLTYEYAPAKPIHASNKPSQTFLYFCGESANPAITKQGSLEGYDYLVLDYDFAATEYAYRNEDGNFVTEPTVPENVHDYTLAFPEGMELCYGVIAYTEGQAQTTKLKKSTLYGLYVRSHEGKWYVTTSSTGEYSADTWYLLSNKLGLFDHISFVFDVNNERVLYFVNGEYVYTQDFSSKNYSVFNVTLLDFGVPNLEKREDKYCVAIDNVAANFYADYKGTDAGLGNFISTGAYAEKNLRSCDDVLFNGDYVAPGTPVLAEITHIGVDEPVNCFTEKAALANIADGDFIKIRGSFKNYTPPVGAEEITFVSLEDTAIVSLSKEASEFYTLQHTGNRYSVRLAGDKALSLNWYDAQSSEGYSALTPVKSQKILPWVQPADTLKIFGKVDRTEPLEPTIEIFREWAWDVNSNGVYDADVDMGIENILKAYTTAELVEMRENGIKEINIIPIYDVKPLAFAIETSTSEGGEKPDFYTLTLNYDKFTDIANLASELAAVKEGESVKVTLYSDVALDAAASIVIPASVSVAFDLNGYSVAQTASAGSMIFDVAEAASLTVNSATAGASVTQSGEGAGCAIVSSSKNVASCSVTFGNNLKVSGASIVYFGNNVANTELDGADINVTINGGEYYGTFASNGALLPISDLETIINVSNATLATLNGEAIFSEKTSVASYSEINVDSAKMIATAYGAEDYELVSFIGNWSVTAKAYIKNSVVTGLTYASNIAYGNGNVFNFVGNLNSDFVVENGVKIAFSNSGASMKSVELAVPGYDEAVEIEYEATLFTFADATESFKTVTWLAPNGDAYAESYWVAGSVITALPSADFEATDLANGWFNAEYKGWKNTSGDANNFIVSADGDNKFAPVADKFSAALKAAKISLVVFEGLAYNVYVPTPAVAGYDVQFVGFYDANGNKIEANVYSDVTLDGTAGWNQLVGLVANDKFVSDEIIVKYTVNGQELESVITIDLFDYANKVNELFACGSEESKLVYAMMSCKYEAYTKAVTAPEASVVANVNVYFESHGEACACGNTEYTAPTITTDDAAIKSYVKGYSYALALDSEFEAKYTFSVVVDKDSDVTGVAVNEINATKVVKADCVEYVVEVELSALAADMAITVTTSEGSVSGSYCLAKYIEETNSEFAKALYVFAKK